MKKAFLWIFLLLFCILCLIPGVGMALGGPAEAAANEQLAQAPQWKAGDGSVNLNFLSDLTAWVDDSFFLRRELISLDRWLTGNVLATSGEDAVVLGKDGWLFYEPTVADYTGTGGLTEQELRRAAHNLSLMAEYCRENGKEFLFVVAPNKNSLYGQYMPDYGVQAGQRDAQRLYSLLDARDVPYADLFAAFGEQDEVLYFAHDSHWNSRGAALGADVINAAFGVQTAFYDGDFSAEAAHTGDLYAMLYPGFSDPETDPVYGGELSYQFTGRATQPDAITLETAGQGSGRLLAYRDSFGNLLYPYLAHSYAAARFSRSVSYDLTQEADFVLVELVERNLSYLVTNLPFMPSPAAQVELPAHSEGVLTVQTAKRSGLVQLKGTVAEDAENVWVLADGIAYEAFLLKDGGFGVNLPEDALWSHVVYAIGGETLMYEITLEDN